MATVYRAEDARLQRIVALKVLPPEFLYDDTFVRRFQQEARVVAGLEHPNIVPIYASGIDDGVPWMSMRLFAGGNLGMLLARRRPDAGEIVRILRSVAEALDYAHARGIVHRDVKPTNILLDDADRVCLGDFGLAHLLQSDRGVTRTGTLIGTPHYMAPEQALGEVLDHRCDIYSLGIVAYEMFVGAPPFTGDSPMAVLLKQVNQPLPRPSHSQLPSALLTALEKAVAKSADERWSSAGAFVSALETATSVAQRHSDIGVRHAGVSEAASRTRRWMPPAVAAAGMASVLMLWTTRDSGSREQPPESPVLEPAIPAPPPATSTPEQRDAAEPAMAGAPQTAAQQTAPVRSLPEPDAPRPAHSQPPAEIPNSRTPVTVPFAPGAAAAPAAADTDIVLPEVAPPAAAEDPSADVVMAPVRLRAPRPDYPAAARAAQIEGDVVLEADVGPDGHVRDVAVLESVHPLIDEAAKKAVLNYEYAPGRRNGKPEAARVRVVVSFKLQ